MQSSPGTQAGVGTDAHESQTESTSWPHCVPVSMPWRWARVRLVAPDRHTCCHEVIGFDPESSSSASTSGALRLFWRQRPTMQPRSVQTHYFFMTVACRGHLLLPFSTPPPSPRRERGGSARRPGRAHAMCRDPSSAVRTFSEHAASPSHAPPPPRSATPVAGAWPPRASCPRAPLRRAPPLVVVAFPVPPARSFPTRLSSERVRVRPRAPRQREGAPASTHPPSPTACVAGAPPRARTCAARPLPAAVGWGWPRHPLRGGAGCGGHRWEGCGVGCGWRGGGGGWGGDAAGSVVL